MYVKPMLVRFGSVRELTKLAHWWWWWCDDDDKGRPVKDSPQDRS
jgi:hypothetical protein